ncbi:MAG: hypothetical protein NW203_13565 [Hyphomonadaceae bacterium]|nr:hypothetical protein [Hyphomonadaceae bacterium]
MAAIGRILLIILVIAVVAAGAGLFLLPKEATRTETITVARPAESVYALIASAPAGQAIGEGATQTVRTATPPHDGQPGTVVADIAYADGTTAVATYTVAPEGEGSTVNVEIVQTLATGLLDNPMARVQALTASPVAPLIEAASTQIETDANALPAARFSSLAYEIVTVPSRPFLFNQNCSPQDAGQIKEAVAQSLLVLRPLLTRYRLTQDGPPVAVETSWENNQYCFQIGYAFTGTPPRIYAGGTVGATPAGTAIRVVFNGPEEQVLPIYDQMEALIAAARLQIGRSFEIYFDDPTRDGGSVQREIYYLVTGDTSRLAQVAPSAAMPAAAPAPAPAPAPADAPAPAAPAAAPAPAAPAATPAPAQ